MKGGRVAVAQIAITPAAHRHPAARPTSGSSREPGPRRDQTRHIERDTNRGRIAR